MEKISRVTFAIVFLSILIRCKSEPPHYLIGKWDMPAGQQVMMFKADSTMIWAFNDNVIADTFRLRYKLDEKKSPNQIDLFDFQSARRFYFGIKWCS